MTVTSIPGSDNLIGVLGSPDGQYLAAATLTGDKLLLFDFASQKWSELANTRVGAPELVCRQ